MSRIIGLAVGALVALSAPVSAATTVNFDTIPTGNVGTQYVAQGVTFSGFVVHDESYGGAVVYDSGTHYAHILGTSRVDFPNPANPMQAATVDYVSFDNLGLNPGTSFYNGFTVTAYGAPANGFGPAALLASAIIAPANSDTGRAQFTTTIAHAGISYLLFSPIQNASGAGLAPIDNFTFGTGAPAAPVPEPGEWAMMAAGLGIVGAIARARRAKA